eukprot:Nitzschia sp. Nitz4//scaffold20_size174350//132919//133986//NITZ4_002120-RA/size174350-processed-gene-0.68-mRNA-1//1//CDS//3329541863//227//frame0
MPLSLTQTNQWVLPTLAALSSIVVIVGISRTLFSNKLDNESNKNDDNDDSALPQHLRRLLYKEKRRKDSVRLLAMKKPMYDNIQMYDPDDQLLCTIAKKKAHWYVRKSLAHWKEPQRSIKLEFVPKGKSSSAQSTSGDSSKSTTSQKELSFNQSDKINQCVVCGDGDKYMRHYIVPYCYRTLFPAAYKTHLPHDIVLLCPDCHLHAEQATQRRQKELEQRVRQPQDDPRPVIFHRRRNQVRSAALALKDPSRKLPPPQIERYQALIREYYNLSPTATLSAKLLEMASALQVNTTNPNYVPGADLVVQHMANHPEAIETFVRDWRGFFFDTMQPRYLPRGWAVESPVCSTTTTTNE